MEGSSLYQRASVTDAPMRRTVLNFSQLSGTAKGAPGRAAFNTRGVLRAGRLRRFDFLDFTKPYPREPVEAKFARGPHRQVNDATAHEGSAISDGDDDTPAIAPSHSHLGTER